MVSSTPGASTPPTKLPSLSAMSKVVALPKSIVISGPPCCLIARDHADQTVGAGILRPVDQHLDAELAVRLADDQQRRLEVGLAQAAQVHVHRAARRWPGSRR